MTLAYANYLFFFNLFLLKGKFVDWWGTIEESESQTSQEQIELVVFDRTEKTFLSSLLIPAAKVGSFISLEKDKGGNVQAVFSLPGLILICS